jgi:hypothetical protein
MLFYVLYVGSFWFLTLAGLFMKILLNPAKQSKQAKQASKQANQQIGLG